MSTIVCILGGSGFLGSILKKRLAADGYRILSIGRSDGVDVRIPEYSVRTLNEIPELSSSVVINCIAATNVDVCERDIDYALDANVKIPNTLKQYYFYRLNMGQDVPKHIIHISTDQVYASKAEDKYAELNLVNNYAATKWLGEKILEGLPALVLRTNFFGKSISGDIGLTDWLYGELSAGKTITGYDNIYFNGVYHGTLASFIDIAIKNRLLGNLNIGSIGKISKFQFCRDFAEYTGFGIDSIIRGEFVPDIDGAKRPENMAMDVSEFKRVAPEICFPISEEIRKATVEYMFKE